MSYNINGQPVGVTVLEHLEDATRTTYKTVSAPDRYSRLGLTTAMNIAAVHKAMADNNISKVSALYTREEDGVVTGVTIIKKGGKTVKEVSFSRERPFVFDVHEITKRIDTHNEPFSEVIVGLVNDCFELKCPGDTPEGKVIGELVFARNLDKRTKVARPTTTLSRSEQWEDGGDSYDHFNH